ncbi:MAG: ABC transporter transmembrane domain-containing protein, partial [Ruoffia tabacinasalis]
MSRLFRYFEGYKLSSIFGPLMKLVEAVLELLVPMIVALIIDVAIPTGDVANIIKYILVMFGIAAAGLAFSITAQFLSAKAAVGFAENLTNDLFEFVLQLPKEVYGTISPGSIVTRLTSDTFQIQSGLNTFFRLFLRSPFIVFGSLIMAAQIDGRMTLIFLAMIAILFVVVGAIIYFANPLYTQIREQFD